VSTVVIGVNHHTASVDLLERVSLSGDAVAKAITNLVSRNNVREAVVLSTCHRTEIYAVAERYHGAYADVQEFLGELAGLPITALAPHVYSAHDHDAITHLFRVAAGLESVVIGESEILGQVGRAWDAAREAGGSRAGLNLLFRRAIEAGKRVRTDTAISRGTASISHAAVEMAAAHLGRSSLDGVAAAVLGVGAIGDGVAMSLRGAGVRELEIVNRTVSRAADLADRVGAVVHGLDALGEVMAHTDVLVTCATTDAPIIQPVDVASALQRRNGRPLVVVDIAVPRNVSPDVDLLDGVRVFNVDHLSEWAAEGIARRQAEASAATAIVDEEVERFLIDATARQAAPLVAELHDLAERVRTGEIERHARKLSGLDPAQLDAVDAITKGIVAKLLHQATTQLKNDAGTPKGDRNAAVMRELFRLDTPTADQPPQP
jgi:glutamyl-tRNA reductase